MLSVSVFRFLSNLVLRCCVLLALGMGTATYARAAQVFNFNGGAVNVSGCTLSGKAYTCDSLPKRQDDDRMVIASGYSVRIKADVVPGWAYGITMSGTARLTSDGNINLTQMNPANGIFTGGSFDAVGTFSAGPPARIVANVSAGALVLGTGPEFRITGTLVSRGAVTLAYAATVDGSITAASVTTNSQVTITGSVTSSGPVYMGYNSSVGGAVTGSAITTDSNVTFKSDVTATTRFILASKGVVNGNVTAPEVELRSDQTVVTGKITASTSLVLGSGVKVNGDVDTGQLKLEASKATITGNASVDFAYLQWAGRVSQTIYCKKGTAAGKCDCVDNQSGWPVNTANGPTCESAKPPSSPLHHFLITHDGAGSVCAPETVTVKACADAACSQVYTAGVDATMSPGGAVVSIGSSGSASATVAQAMPGEVDLTLTHAGSAPASCQNSLTGQSSCTMKFSGGIVFDIAAGAFRAGESFSATITARAFNEASKSCEAAFQNQDKDVQYACAYGAPGTGSEKLGLKDDVTTASAQLMCVPASGAAGATGTTVKTHFDQKGVARMTLGYQDAGRVLLVAGLDDAAGSAPFDVAPYRFRLAPPPGPIRAGASVAVAVEAVSANDRVTRNFDSSRLQAGSTRTAFSVACVSPQGARNAALDAPSVEFSDGAAQAKVAWAEVGSMHLKARTETGFPNTTLYIEGSTGSDAGCASLGPFIPHHFMVEQPAPARTPSNLYYAGEPIPLKVSARNAAGAVTENFRNGLVSETVTLAAFDVKTGTTANPGGGVLEGASIAAVLFDKGVADAKPAYAAPAATPPARRQPLAPVTIRLRARNAAAMAGNAPAAAVSSEGNEAQETARPLIRNGRLRIATVFGRTGSLLELPVTAEYWTGNSWLLNDLDTFTVVPAAAIAQSAQAHAAAGVQGAKPASQQFTALTIAGGQTKLPMQSARPGWIDVAFNLGSGAQDQACLTTHPTTTGAALPWLQSLSGCTDPSGRATFGIFPVESRRIIHVREVFN